MHDQLNLSCPSPPGVEGADGLDRGHAARGRGDKGREGEGGKGEGGEASFAFVLPLFFLDLLILLRAENYPAR